jgi:Winged helix DNA-binding domain
MEQLDAIIHKTLPRGERLEFVRLRAIVNATEGNLGAHLGTLESAGYIRNRNAGKSRAGVACHSGCTRSCRGVMQKAG